MKASDFTTRRSGDLQPIPEGGHAFTPRPLPPAGFELDVQIGKALSEAEAALGRLDGMGQMLPEADLLIQPFLRREAVMSSRIEGTQTTYPGLLFFEAAQSTNDSHDPEAQEVANYIVALTYGLRECGRSSRIDGRVIRGMHERLLSNRRKPIEHLAQFRTQQVFVGPAPIARARYVPPRAADVPRLFADLELFINHGAKQFPLLISLAFTHYQFEAIHPFEDGNGRIGRLLIALMLCTEGRLKRPMLYLSAFFEQHRSRYYDLLLEVSRNGAWKDWILFFLEGVREQAEDALVRTKQLLELQISYQKRFSSARSTTLIWRFIKELFASPVITAPMAQRLLDISYPTARELIAKMLKAQIIKRFEDTGRAHYFFAHEIIDIIERPDAISQPDSAGSASFAQNAI